jgi:hypothetical protein
MKPKKTKISYSIILTDLQWDELIQNHCESDLVDYLLTQTSGHDFYWSEKEYGRKIFFTIDIDVIPESILLTKIVDILTESLGAD